MKRLLVILILYIFFIERWYPIFSQESYQKEIKIQVQEIKEEVPYYRSFRIQIQNLTDKEKTILGKIQFANGETCHFIFELSPYEQKEQLRHCQVQKRRGNYQVIIEKEYPFRIQH